MCRIAGAMDGAGTIVDVRARAKPPPWIRRAASCFLVGAGPGDAELLTLKAARLLREAEVVVYDRLVGPGILKLANPAAELIYVGKERARHFMRQTEINALLVRRGQLGQRVVRLKGGDPLIFGRGGEEVEALLEAGVRVRDRARGSPPPPAALPPRSSR